MRTCSTMELLSLWLARLPCGGATDEAGSIMYGCWARSQCTTLQMRAVSGTLFMGSSSSPTSALIKVDLPESR